MNSPVAYINGRFVSLSAAGLPLFDAGIVHGAIIYDAVRTFRKKLFRLDDHLARFRQSCELARVPQSMANNQLRGIAEELVARNGSTLPASGELMLVISATPGTVGRYLGEITDGPPTLAMNTFSLDFSLTQSLYSQGARLAVPPTKAPRPDVIDPRIKQRSRLHWWIANQQAKEIDPHATALLCDDEGRITETSAANLLVVRNREVLRAEPGRVLEGISMQVTQELCKSAGIPFRRAPLTLADCFAADEVLLTSTSWCVAGVSSINNQTIPWPGPVLRQLQDAWSHLIGLELVATFGN